MTVEVRPVRDKRDLETFVRLPWDIYRDDPNWVPPLLSDVRFQHDASRNPFFERNHLQDFVAYDGGRPVGRISAVHNVVSNEFWDDKIGFFGFFESVDRQDVARALVREAARWLEGRGLTSVRGPMNYSTNDDIGALIEGFDRPPVLLMPYNPRYYPELLTSTGLTKVKDVVAYVMEPIVLPERLERGAELVKKRRSITVRPLNMKKFEAELQAIQDIYNKAWERNWGFCPMSAREIEHMAEQFKAAVDPNLVLFAEMDNQPVAFLLAFPDLNIALKHVNGRLFPFGLFKFLWHKRKIRSGRVLTLGVKEGYRKLGIDALLMFEVTRAAQRIGYTMGEFSWILEDNLIARTPLENLGAKVYKTYRIYEAPVERLR
ncbi:MAG: GNAT family N-acetyltransferase [Candidatus Eisenbacteria bacterium]|nr:GNAT family N-acetyltransferase [Candidatus Eisenbacteria bacterium]